MHCIVHAKTTVARGLHKTRLNIQCTLFLCTTSSVSNFLRRNKSFNVFCLLIAHPSAHRSSFSCSTDTLQEPFVQDSCSMPQWLLFMAANYMGSASRIQALDSPEINLSVTDFRCGEYLAYFSCPCGYERLLKGQQFKSQPKLDQEGWQWHRTKAYLSSKHVYSRACTQYPGIAAL